MALNASKIGGNKKESKFQMDPLEPGVYPTRLVQLIDLGLQPQRPYQGQEKPPAHEIMLTYEFVDEFLKDEDGNDVEDKPRWYSETIPLHPLIADRAKSTQRYNALDPEGKYGGDFVKCLSTPVNVTLVHNQNGDKLYVNVANIAAMRPRDAAKCPELVNEPKYFDLDDPDVNVFGSLPEWIQDKIKKNLNFKGSKLEAALAGEVVPTNKKREEPKKAADFEPAGPDVGDGDDRPW